MVDGVLEQGVRGISDLIVRPGLINVDFADVKTIMHEAEVLLMELGNLAEKIGRKKLLLELLNTPVKP